MISVRTRRHTAMSDPLSPAAIARFAEVAAGHVGDDKVPGLVALIAHRDQVHVEVLGSLRVGGPPGPPVSAFPPPPPPQADHSRPRHAPRWRRSARPRRAGRPGAPRA